MAATGDLSRVPSYCVSDNGLLVEISGSGGVGEALAAGGLDRGIERDRELAARGAAGLEFALADPDVDDVVADVEPLGECGHLKWPRCGRLNWPHLCPICP